LSQLTQGYDKAAAPPRSLPSGLWPSAPDSHRICWPSGWRRSRARRPGWAAITAGGEFHPAL